MVTRFRGLWQAAAWVLLVAGISPGQFEEPYDADPDAEKAFAELVESYRDRTSLHVISELSLTLLEGEVESEPSKASAEFMYVNGGGGMARIRDFKCYFSDGVFYAVHGDTDHSYFRAEYLGSPYWELLAHYQDLPYPHLAILWGEEAMDEVWMQLQPQTPLLVPTEVAEIERDGSTLRNIILSSPDARLDLVVDPATGLIHSMEHEVSGGPLVQPGTKRLATLRLEYPDTSEAEARQAVTFDPGQRQRVDTLVALLPPPDPAEVPPGQPARARGVAEGDEAPGFVLATMDNNAIDLEDLRGKVVVLDFWATWCGPCVAALPQLHEFASWARDQQLPVEVITMNVFEARGEDDTPDARREQVQKFWEAKGFTLPVAMDYTDQTAVEYGVRGIPATFIIRSDGIIHARHSGFSGSYLAELKRGVQEALAALEVQEEGAGGRE